MEINFNSDNSNSNTGFPSYTHDYFNDLSINPIVLVIVSVILILYYLLFASLGVDRGSSDTSEGSSKSVMFLEILLWSVFILLLLLNGIYYFFNINVVANIKHLFSPMPEMNFKVETDETKSPELNYIKQVFHVPGNNYTFEDSKAICKAYGAELANYKHLEDAYQKGADWCSYGWSEGQMAYFPTQFDKWKTLQGVKGHEHDCGRPGINGGYIDNANIKFGVNCYGYKPKINQLGYDLMQNTTVYPKTQEEINFDREVNKWRQNIDTIAVAPFNNNRWSVI